MNKLQLDWWQPQPIGIGVMVQPIFLVIQTPNWCSENTIYITPFRLPFSVYNYTQLFYFALIEVNFILFTCTCWRHKCFCYSTMHAVLFVILRIYFYPIDNLRLCLLPNGYVALLLLIGMDLIYFPWWKSCSILRFENRHKQTLNKFLVAT